MCKTSTCPFPGALGRCCSSSSALSPVLPFSKALSLISESFADLSAETPPAFRAQTTAGISPAARASFALPPSGVCKPLLHVNTRQTARIPIYTYKVPIAGLIHSVQSRKPAEKWRKSRTFAAPPTLEPSGTPGCRSRGGGLCASGGHGSTHACAGRDERGDNAQPDGASAPRREGPPVGVGSAEPRRSVLKHSFQTSVCK